MKAQVLSNVPIGAKFGYMELSCPEIASEKNAGRFFMVSVRGDEKSTDPILKRPFAICDIKSPDTFSFLYMIVGRGTSLLTKCKHGEYLNITGPLGNYFKLIKNKSVALVAGGIGIAPMIITAKRLREHGCRITLFYGGRNASDIIMRDTLINICDELVPVTEDGSLGIKGLVTVPIKERISEFQKVYACGPNRMLMAVNDICSEANTNIEVSLDEHMACGVGACLGCLVPIKEKSDTVMKRCCVEGPVFNGAKVDWSVLCRG